MELSYPNFSLEQKLLHRFDMVAGVDEAGRGAWAGPVVAAVVALDPAEASVLLKLGINDSKRLTSEKRQEFSVAIKAAAIAYEVVFVHSQRIDAINILEATKEAVREGYLRMQPRPAALVLDYLKIENLACYQESLPKGDAKVLSIAAASILAKVSRDAFMQEQALVYKGYGFESNKGYGVRIHREGLKNLGVCPLHRRSYRPVREQLERENKVSRKGLDGDVIAI